MTMGPISKKIEKKTKKTFHKIHILQDQDYQIFSRLQSLLTCEYLQVEKDFFQGKVCLDAGCGLNANATYALLRLGAAKVYALDINEAILEYAPRYLRGFNGRFELIVGSVTDMEFPDNFFDFTHSSGLLHHISDTFKGLKELVRVTKAGGILYININGQGGLVRLVTNFFRELYARDSKFRNFVDNLDEKYFAELWHWLAKMMQEQGDPLAKNIPQAFFKELFNHDLALSIKDRITAPYYHEISEERIRKWLGENGFIKIVRLTRYPRFQNMRRFLSPFYYKYDHKFSRLLYGDGFIQLKAQKKG